MKAKALFKEAMGKHDLINLMPGTVWIAAIHYRGDLGYEIYAAPTEEALYEKLLGGYCQWRWGPVEGGMREGSTSREEMQVQVGSDDPKTLVKAYVNQYRQMGDQVFLDVNEYNLGGED